MLNEKEFEFLGIKKFHEKGYTGSNVYIASKEDVIAGVFDDVLTLRDEGIDKYTKHGTACMDFIRQILPDALKAAIKTSGMVNKKTGVVNSEGLNFLMQTPPDILTTSFFKNGDDEYPMFDMYKKLKEKGCFLCCAAGNKQEELEELTKNDVWKAIGACVLDDDKIKLEKSYAAGEEMDFVSLHDLVCAWDGENKRGTSYSSPVFAAMCGLVQDFFIMNTTKKLTHEKLLEFVKDNCIDLAEAGKDVRTGHGLFVLPDPDSIDITKYADAEFLKTWENILGNEFEKNKTEEGGNQMETENIRYRFLKDIPEGEFHDVIEFMIENGYIKGFNTAFFEDIEETEVDLSLDMVRMFVINYRAGLYKEIGG